MTARRALSPRILVPLALAGLAALALGAILLAAAPIDATETVPADGAVVDKPVRSLRVFFDEVPDVEKSKLELEGPAGEMKVEGLHTMGSDDLMARVVGAMPDGEYTARWSTVGTNGEAATGEWTFTLKRGGS